MHVFFVFFLNSGLRFFPVWHIMAANCQEKEQRRHLILDTNVSVNPLHQHLASGCSYEPIISLHLWVCLGLQSVGPSAFFCCSAAFGQWSNRLHLISGCGLGMRGSGGAFRLLTLRSDALSSPLRLRVLSKSRMFCFHPRLQKSCTTGTKTW